jgi:hypothetical protein
MDGEGGREKGKERYGRWWEERNAFVALCIWDGTMEDQDLAICFAQIML